MSELTGFGPKGSVTHFDSSYEVTKRTYDLAVPITTADGSTLIVRTSDLANFDEKSSFDNADSAANAAQLLADYPYHKWSTVYILEVTKVNEFASTDGVEMLVGSTTNITPWDKAEEQDFPTDSYYFQLETEDGEVLEVEDGFENQDETESAADEMLASHGTAYKWVVYSSDGIAVSES